jgi:hypothetical protein
LTCEEVSKLCGEEAAATLEELFEGERAKRRGGRPDPFPKPEKSEGSKPDAKPAPVKPTEAAVKPNVVKLVRDKNGVLYYRAADGSLRRWLGGEPKPKPIEPGPVKEEEEKKAAVVQLRPVEQKKPR